MEDKTPMYLIAMVGIVAVVAIVYMLTGSSNSTPTTELSAGGAITGNAIADDFEPVIGLNVIGRIILAVLLGSAVMHMYHKW